MLALILIGATHAQGLTARTSDGRTVILRADGTWAFEAPPVGAPGAQGGACTRVVGTTFDGTGKTLKFMNDPIVVSKDGKTGVVMRLSKSTAGAVAWSVVAEGAARCISDKDTINLVFTDGARLDVENDSTSNCDSIQTIYFGSVFGRLSALQALSQKELASLRVSTADGVIEQDVAPGEAAAIKLGFSCLSQ